MGSQRYHRSKLCESHSKSHACLRIESIDVLLIKVNGLLTPLFQNRETMAILPINPAAEIFAIILIFNHFIENDL